MPASTSETAARVLSSSADSTWSERMALMGCSRCWGEQAGMSRAGRRNNAISPADFDHITANLRRGPGLSRKSMVDPQPQHRWPGFSAQGNWLQGVHQLCLKPAVRLRFGMPCGVSLIEPLMLTPPNNFCSAPILRSHFSSVDENDWPAMKLVPVSAMLSFADWSV